MYVETVIVQQPQMMMMPIYTAPWTTGLFACCDDLGICMCGCFCTPCLFGYNSFAMTGRDCCGACTLYAFFTFCGCLCDSFLGDMMADYVGARVRTQIRMKYGLMEDPCNDFVVHLCCPHCALCQEAREIKYRALAGPSMVAIQQPMQQMAPQQMYGVAPPQQQQYYQPSAQQQQQYAPQQQQYAPQQQQQQYAQQGPPPQQQYQQGPPPQQQQQYAPHQGPPPQQQYAPQQGPPPEQQQQQQYTPQVPYQQK